LSLQISIISDISLDPSEISPFLSAFIYQPCFYQPSDISLEPSDVSLEPSDVSLIFISLLFYQP
jgi:hypothetical protein